MQKKNDRLKTNNGNVCLTKCNDMNKLAINPQSMGSYKNDFDFCFTLDDDINVLIKGKCDINDNNIYTTPDETLMFFKYPFDQLIFLKLYNITTFDECIDWTSENIHLPFQTIKRIHNCAWIAFGKDISKIPFSVLDYYYTNIIQEHWVKDYSINSAISENDLLHFFTYDEYTKCMDLYIKKYIIQWESIESHYGNLKRFIYKYLIKNISI
jgi:hypothetical protein